MRLTPAESLLPKKKGPKRQASRLHRMADRVREYLDTPKPGDWDKATPELFVGLYAVWHEKVYGQFPEYLADEFVPAMNAARRCLENEWQSKPKDMFQFMRWTWAREKKEFPTRESDFMISWKYQFSNKLATKYRILTQA